jgi:hypothetical protein
LEVLGAAPPAASLRGIELRQAVRDAEAELARRIRAGEFDEGLEDLAGRLRAHVRRQLDVARPGYAD